MDRQMKDGKRTLPLRGAKGFTLIELMVVVVIMGLLVALVAPRFFGKVEQSKLKTAQAQIELLGSALDMFRLDVGAYPAASDGIEALRTRPQAATGWAGPYLKKEVPNDPWGRPYVYSYPGSNGDYELVSYGADGVEGGDGENQDIVSWRGLK